MRQSVTLFCFLFVVVHLDIADSLWCRSSCNVYSNCGRRKRDVSKINVPCKFELYDTNSDGKLLPEEFEDSLKKLGFKDNLTLFETLDGDSSGDVSKNEFYDEAVKQAKSMLFEECIGRTVN